MASASTLVIGQVQCVWPLQAELGEGTCWSEREQALYFVDIIGHRLHRYTPATQACDSWQFDEEITALAERQNNPGLLVALRQDLALFDPTSGGLTRLHTPESRSGHRLNDGKCDRQGRFWIGSMDHAGHTATGAMYRYDPDGRCERLLENIRISNGPTWSADGATLFLNETGHGLTWAMDFDPDTGTLLNRRLWRDYDPAEGAPDGMTTDSAGHLWIARWGGSAVTCHDRDGAVLGRIPLPVSNVTNCAFGGPNLDTLYITTARAGLTPEQLAQQPLAGGLFSVPTHATGVSAARFCG